MLTNKVSNLYLMKLIVRKQSRFLGDYASIISESHQTFSIKGSMRRELQRARDFLKYLWHFVSINIIMNSDILF